MSTELVASSKIKILGSAKKARAIVNNCLCPCDILELSSKQMHEMFQVTLHSIFLIEQAVSKGMIKNKMIEKIGNNAFHTLKNLNNFVYYGYNEIPTNAFYSYFPKNVIVCFDYPKDFLATVPVNRSGYCYRKTPRQTKNTSMQTIALLAIYFLSVNSTNEVLKDKRVRKALSLSIDRNYIVKNVTKGAETPAAALVPPPVYDIEGSFREKGGDYFSVKEEDYSKNIDEAKRLLAEAGYPDGKNFPVIEFTVESESSKNIFEAIQQMWKENLNIDAVANQLEWGVFMQTTRGDKNFQIARSGWMGDYNDPMTFLDTFLSYSPQNTGSYYNKEYEELIKSALTN